MANDGTGKQAAPDAPIARAGVCQGLKRDTLELRSVNPGHHDRRRWTRLPRNTGLGQLGSAAGDTHPARLDADGDRDGLGDGGAKEDPAKVLDDGGEVGGHRCHSAFGSFEDSRRLA